MNFLAGIGLKVWGIIAAVGAVLASLALLLRGARKDGRNSVIAEMSKNREETAARMAEASAQAPKLGSEVAADARKGIF